MVFVVIIIVGVFLMLSLSLIVTASRNRRQNDTAAVNKSIYDRTPAMSSRKSSVPSPATRKPHLHRKDNKPNNMNCDRYLFTAVFKETGKKRSKKEAFVFPGERAADVIRGMGYGEPIECIPYEWEPMSDKQKEVLRDRTNGHYQNNLCLQDASGLLDQILSGDKRPKDEFFFYADSMRVPVSYYYGENRLTGSLLHDLKGRDNVALRVYLAYCKKKKIQPENLLVSEHRSVFYGFADRFATREELDKYVTDAWNNRAGDKAREKEIVEYLKEKRLLL